MDREEEITKRQTAITMYDAGCSMLNIQEKLGDVSVSDIRKWSVCLLGGIPKKKKQKKQKVNKKRVKYKNKRLARREARSKKKVKINTFDDWKKRVFASWKDSPEQKAIRRSPEYQEWRIKVLGRDNYTCQHCQKTGGTLHVHHIKTFKMNPELRLAVDNGVVLCKKCHEKVHLARMRKPKILRMKA